MIDTDRLLEVHEILSAAMGQSRLRFFTLDNVPHLEVAIGPAYRWLRIVAYRDTLTMWEQHGGGWTLCGEFDSAEAAASRVIRVDERGPQIPSPTLQINSGRLDEQLKETPGGIRGLLIDSDVIEACGQFDLQAFLRILPLIQEGLIIDPCVDASFYWQDTGIVHRKPWVGIVHDVNIENVQLPSFLRTRRWELSRRFCRGLFVFGEQARQRLSSIAACSVAVIPVLVDPPQSKFCKDKHYGSEPSNVLLIQGTVGLFGSSRQVIGVRSLRGRAPVSDEGSEPLFCKHPQVIDYTFSSSVVCLDEVASRHGRVLAECIVRNTPVVAEKCDVSVAHLGNDYPLFRSKNAELPFPTASQIDEAHRFILGLDKDRYFAESFRSAWNRSQIFRITARAWNERLVLMSHARSGSTSLFRILKSHQWIRIINEPFNPTCERPVDSWGYSYLHGVTDMQSFRDVSADLFACFNSVKHIMGQLVEELEEALLSFASRRILLNRKNLLQAAVSKCIALQTRNWHRHHGPPPLGESLSVLHPIDVEEVRRYLEWQREYLDKIRNFLILHELPFAEVVYEDLFGIDADLPTKVELIETLLGELGLSTDQECWNPDAAFEILDFEKNKMNSNATYARVPNIAEVEAELASDEYGSLEL